MCIKRTIAKIMTVVLAVTVLIAMMPHTSMTAYADDTEGAKDGSFIKLDTPTNIQLNGTVLSWDAVANADYYNVFFSYMDDSEPGLYHSIGGGSPTTTEFDIEADVRESMSVCGFTDSDTITVVIEIRACTNDPEHYSDSDNSDEFRFRLSETGLDIHITKLDTPTNIQLNGTKLSWDAVEHADFYRVDFLYKDDSDPGSIHSPGGVSSTTTELDIEANVRRDMSVCGFTDSDTLTVVVMVRACTNDKDQYSDSDDSDKFRFRLSETGLDIHITKLDTPTNIQLNGTVLSWDAVANADYYFINLEFSRESEPGCSHSTGGFTAATNQADIEQEVRSSISVIGFTDSDNITIKIEVEACTNSTNAFSESDRGSLTASDFVQCLILGHTYGDWTTTKEPTYTEKGLKERTCTICGKTETEEIPAIAEPVASGECGDSLTWELDSYGTLTISGSGRMDNYTANEYGPWYRWRDSINSVEIEEGVNTIGNFAFFGLSNLESVTIPGSVTSIGTSAFEDCSSLASVTIPDSVTIIDDGAFFGCSGLTDITVPISLWYTFRSMKEQFVNISFTIGNGSATSIGDEEFLNCSNLERITIPRGVTGIGNSAFAGCSSLESIAIPNGMTSIGDKAFNSCSSLPSITIPDSVTSIGISVINKCNKLTDITIPVNHWNSFVTWKERFVNITFTKGDGSVTEIKDGMLRDCTGLTSVTIPYGVTRIGDSAFRECRSLTRVEIPGSVRSIWHYAFYNCTSLTNITIPDGVSRIYGYTFRGCSSLSSITIPDSVTKIDELSFEGCSNLTSITIPDNVTSIGGQAFMGCGLESISLPGNLSEITEESFAYCGNLSSVTIQDGVTDIGKNAFLNCNSLSSITIPDSVVRISDGAFKECRSLESVTIPNSVISIGSDAFHGCSLTSITIPDSVINLGYQVFCNCTNLTSVELPDSLTGIPDGAFTDCSSLTGITIPESITSIGGAAFSGCSNLESIKIPDSVTSIGEQAFDNCEAVTFYVKKGSEADSYLKTLFSEDSFVYICDYGHVWNTEYSADVPATCLEEGRESIHCSVCDEIQEGSERPIPITDHTYGEWTVTKKETCTEDGSREKVCSVCSDTVTEVIPATGHSFEDDFTVDTAPTCKEEGSKSRHCADCEEKIDVTAIPIIDHIYDDWVITLEPSCTEDGIREKTCTMCGGKVTESMSATGHDWEDDYTVDLEPSCTGKGSKSIHCSKCTEVKDVTEIDATGHTWGEWQEVKPSTCIDPGLQQHSCEVCGFTETADLDPNGHDFEEEFTVDVEPTCTTDGSRSRHCRNCDAVTDSEVITSTGHLYGDWVIEDSTCTEPGQRVAECTVCGEPLTEVIPAKGHEWNSEPTVDVEPTCGADGSESIHCARCNASKEGTAQAIPKTGQHSFGEWVTTKEPTASAEGTRERTCEVCGAEEQEKIPKKAGLSVKNLWASQHSVGKVLFKWTKKDGVSVNGWILKYRTRKIGAGGSWSGWKYKNCGKNTYEAWIDVPVDYVIEIHAQAKGDSTWSTGIITTPAGGKYQAMKNTYVLNVTSKPYKRLTGSTITLKKGQSIKVRPDYEYPIADYDKRPRLYPNQMLYDVDYKSIVNITKPDGSTYTGGMIDGIATIKGAKAGSTKIVFRAPNGRTQVFTINVTG